MKQWIEPEPVEVPRELLAAVGGHRLVAETLVRRGITDVRTARAFLNPDMYKPSSPFDLPDMDNAVERLTRAIHQHETICVCGDFDVDGQTATTLLVSALQDLGARVVYHIPNRLSEGHGVHIPKLKQVIDGGVQLILTCDTGIAEHEAVDYANSCGVDVVITDHHHLPTTLPNAYAAVNPKRLPETHPLRELPGVGCAYKLVEALYDHFGRGDTSHFLDLVALGIVADVAVLTGDTRYLLQRGLQVLRQTERLGLKIMMETAELQPAQVSEEHIGFALGPRLNALGRLDDANLIVELLTTNDLERARILANQLEGLNNQRKLLSEQVYHGAQAQIAQDSTLLDYGALVLANPHWHTGVVGIVANRLAEHYNRPTVLLATPPDGIARGSARSVYGCDITAAIAQQEDILLAFGGHTMAAGLRLLADHIPDFRRRLSRTVKQILGEVQPILTQQIDGYVALNELSLDLVKEIERLAPFGPGNPPLTLASKDMTLKHHRILGRSQEHLQLTVEDAKGTSQRVIWWQGAKETTPQGHFDLAYVVRASDYQGKRDLQIVFVDARPAEDEEDWTAPKKVTVVDCRQENDPLATLNQLKTQLPELVIWAEGVNIVSGHDRYSLDAAPTLVIWTLPPSTAELQLVMQKVSPQIVYLFADAVDDSLDGFVKRLGGLVKYALNNTQGDVGPSMLAAKTGQREVTVRKGIHWLAAQGAITVVVEDGDMIRLGKGSQVKQAELEQITTELKALLAETAAYRRYFGEADAEILLK
jgi:single-stranded-DNA-specific exonuclease